jgi:hypothetical protein
MKTTSSRSLLFLATAALTFLCTARDVDALRSSLSRKASSIALGPGAIAGCVVVAGSEAAPIVFGRSGGVKTPVAAAAVYGKGRVVAVTHHGFVEKKNALRRDNAIFLRECLRWLAGGSSPTTIYAERGRDAIAYAATEALKGAQALNVKPLSGYDMLRSLPPGVIVITMPDSHSLEDAGKLTEFVKNGGRVLAPVVGWGWHQINGRRPFSKSPFNVALGPTGIYTGGAFAEAGKDGLYEIAGIDDLPGLSADNALELAEGSMTMPPALGGRCLFTLETLADALPSTDMKWRPRLEALARTAQKGVIPSPSSPLGRSRVRERLAYALFQRSWLANPERNWAASAAAATYPGLPAKNAKRVTRDMEVDMAVPRWHGTGLFAGAGESLTVTLADGAEKLGLRVRVGSTTCRITDHNEWRRAPVVDVELPLDKKTTTFASPFGGLVYIVVPEGRFGKTSVNIGPACLAPRFLDGIDTPDTWVAQLRENRAPMVELESECIVITVPYERVQNLADPRPLLQVWREIMANDAKLVGMPVKRASPERICADVQLCCGYMHAGYPIMMPMVCMRNLLSESTIRAGTEDDVWGFFHEMGHNHQNYDWTFNGTTEVTVNFFSLYNLEKICGRGIRDNAKIGGEGFRRRVEAWNAAGRPYDEWLADPFLALDFFARLIEKYGWEAFERFFAEYRSLPQSERPKTDLEKREQWCRRLSKIVGEDLSKEFRFMGVRQREK